MDSPKPKGKGRGGSRPNSGRPSTNVTNGRDDFDAKFIAKGKEDFEWFYARLKELAAGVQVQRETQDGPLVYQLPPDFKAISYYFNRMAGQPRQAVTVDAGKIDMATAVGLTNQAAVEYSDPDDETKEQG